MAHANWVNVDAVALVPGVIVCDVRAGLPFPSDEFDVVYHSHLLEHLSRLDTVRFLGECRRVLRPGGIHRVVVPDLEDAVKAYISTIKKTEGGGGLRARQHDWMVVELFDQFARERGGGDMVSFIKDAEGELLNYIEGRIGGDIVKMAKQTTVKAPPPLAMLGLKWCFTCCLNIIRDPKRLREVLAKRLLGDEYALLEMGRFRRCGEIHRWMYDEGSLGDLLTVAGYHSILRMECSKSAIDGWANCQLDTLDRGFPRKPHSIYMECRK